MIKISIILPVYKVEKYIDKCLESLVNQTYKNLEIILIDDGSPDKSGKKCDVWAEKDERIKVFHKENGGVSSARNLGLEKATGDFIAFVDPDDSVDLTMFEKLLKKSIKEKSDICMCGYNFVYENGDSVIVKEINLPKLSDEISFDFFILPNMKADKNIIYSENIMGSACRMLIKKEVVDKIRFEKVSICEDILFVVDILKSVKKVAVLDENLYLYTQRNDSATVICNEHKIANHKAFSKLFIERMKDVLSEELFQALKFYLFVNPVALCMRARNKSLLKQVINDEFFKSLNTKENYNARQKITKQFSRKVLNCLLYHKMFWICSFIYKFI